MTRIGKIGLKVKLFLLTTFALMTLGGLAHGQVVPVDHYKCYLIEPQSQVPGPLLLSDQFRDEVVDVLISRLLCAPVSKEGSPINNPDIHLEAYEIPAPPLDPPALVNLFSLNDHLPPELGVRVIRPLFLLVPTRKERLQ
jgi:hypothetical protein